MARYSQLDGALRSVFEAGNLNPSLVMSALREPDYFKATFDLEAPETQRLIEEMSVQLARIRAASMSERADVVAVSVPFGLYVSEAMFRTWRDRYGFDLDPRMLTSSAADDAILSAAARAGVSGHAFTTAFRDHDGAPFFFGLDGHLTADGHRFYAEQLRAAITATLERRARCGHDRPEGGVVSAW